MKPSNHTGSYYAASINKETNYPELQGDHNADVCIIGAGFSGVSAGLHLSELGYKVIIIEANKVCLLYTSPSPRDQRGSRMPSSA